MIRTAILTGLLVVLLSMAYSRSLLPGVTADPLHAQVRSSPVAEPAPEENEAPAQPVKAVTAAPAHRGQRTVPLKLLPDEPAAPAPKSKPSAEVAREEALPAPAPAKQVPETPAMAEAQPVKRAAPLAAPLPESAPVAAPDSEERSPPPVVAEAKPVPPAPVSVAPLEELPVRDVATPRVMIPRDLPLPSETAMSREGRTTTAFREVVPLEDKPVPSTEPAPRKNPAARTEPLPQLMTPEERTRELYGLARDMEDKFISRLMR